jgi:hypothetical protein
MYCLFDFRHRSFIVLPQLLTLHNIPYQTIRQDPGDYVFTFPEALHVVVNEGFNVAEALNYVNKGWKKHIDTVAQCTCGEQKKIQRIANEFNCLPQKEID